MLFFSVYIVYLAVIIIMISWTLFDQDLDERLKKKIIGYWLLLLGISLIIFGFLTALPPELFQAQPNPKPAQNIISIVQL